MAVPTGSGVGSAPDGIDPPVVPDARASPRLRSTVASVGAIALVVKLAITAKDLAIAQRFGTSADLDIFLLAFALSQFAMTVIAGSFSSALVPTYIDVREQRGRDAANRLFEGAFADGLRALVGAAVLLSVAGPVLLYLLVPDDYDAGGRLAVVLFFVLLPTLLLNGASVAWAAILGAEERYTRSVVPQLLAPIVPLTAVIVATGGEPSVIWLAIATTIGFAIEAAATGWLLHREHIPILPRRLPTDPERRTVVAQFLPVAAGGCLMASTLLIDQAMSVRLGVGSVAALSFGSKAAAFLTSVGALALTTAALPHFSKVAALGDRSELVSGLKHWIRIILVVSVPATVVMIVLSKPIIAIVFERGAFTAEDTDLVSQIQQLFMLQLPAYLVGVVIVRVISALKANVILLWGAGLNLAVNIGLNIVLGAWLGVPGIALSTSVVYWVSTIFLGLMLLRRLPTRDPDEH